MYYTFELNGIPKISDFYTVTRNTVWQIADKRNILIFITDGSCEITCDGETEILEKGDVFFIPKEHSYVRRPVNEKMCTMVYLHFEMPSSPVGNGYRELLKKLTDIKNKTDMDILKGDINSEYANTVYLQNKNTFKAYEKIFTLLSGINLFSAKRTLTAALDSSIILLEILSRISHETINRILTDSSIKDIINIPPKLKKAIGYITENYYTAISLDGLSKYCNVSKQQMIRYFKASLNTTPVKYISDYKISRAKEMLFYSQMSVKEIADELGFDNQHYFTRVFKKTTNESPTAYRYRVLHYDDKQSGENN